MLADKDRIFTNLYGQNDWRLEQPASGVTGLTRQIFLPKAGTPLLRK